MALRIVIIGGVACGLKAASRARRRDAEAEITVIEQGRQVAWAACGMPYLVGGRIKKTEELVQRTPAYFERIKGIRMLTGCRATAIDRERKVVSYRPLNGEQPEAELPYDKLVLATGARPAAPPIPGSHLPGVVQLRALADAETVRQAAQGARRAVIVGAGPIGIEMAEAFRQNNLEVVLLELQAHVLPGLLDFEMARLLERHLEEKGVAVHCGSRLVRFEGEGRLERVVSERGSFEAEVALLSIGVRPNVELAVAAGLALGETGAIRVDEHLRTTDADIYAGGDCVESRHLITGRPVYIPLGTTANKHGRVIGDNLTGGEETFPGVLGTTLLKAFDYTVARSGLTRQAAEGLGYAVHEALVPAPDHAHYYGEAQVFALKLVCERPGGRILGVQMVGPGEVARRLDAVVAAMNFGATARQLSLMDFGYAPPYASAMDVLITAANVLRNKLEGLAPAATPEEVEAELASGKPPLLLDVRAKPELVKVRLAAAAGEVVNVPFIQLRKGMRKLPRDRELVTFCWGGLRAYEAARMLRQAGFERVRFLDGSLWTWPYELEEEREWRSGP